MSEADQLLNAEQSGEGVDTQASQTDANLGRYSSSVQASQPLRTQLCTSSRGLLSPHASASHAHLLLCSLPGAGEVRPVVLQRFIYDRSHTTVGSHHWRYAEGKKLLLKRAFSVVRWWSAHTRVSVCVFRYYELPVCCRAVAGSSWFAQLGPSSHRGTKQLLYTSQSYYSMCASWLKSLSRDTDLRPVKASESELYYSCTHW